jgi:CBS domain-containing protein
MKTVREILARKGSEVSSVRVDETVFAALELMAAKEIGAVLVFDGPRPVGIFTEREYARQVILKGKASRDTPVRDVMCRDFVCVRPEQTVEDCMALMTDKRVRHLPVLEGGHVVGIISIGDAVQAMISEKEFIIEQLANYIQNG